MRIIKESPVGLDKFLADEMPSRFFGTFSSSRGKSHFSMMSNIEIQLSHGTMHVEILDYDMGIDISTHDIRSWKRDKDTLTMIGSDGALFKLTW